MKGRGEKRFDEEFYRERVNAFPFVKLMGMKLLKPVSRGTVVADSTVLRLGSTVAFGSSEVRNGEGETVAFGTATYYILPRKERGIVPAIMSEVPGARRERG